MFQNYTARSSGMLSQQPPDLMYSSPFCDMRTGDEPWFPLGLHLVDIPRTSYVQRSNLTEPFKISQRYDETSKLYWFKMKIKIELSHAKPINQLWMKLVFN